MTRKRRLLILCTGNSARSQMAEGLVNHFLAETWEAVSAGTAPTGYVHPLAVRALAELDIDIFLRRSKSVDEYQGAAFDRVVTVCEGAAQDCAIWLRQGRVAHVAFADPAAATGTDDERLTGFRRVRDGIQRRVLGLLEQFGETAGDAHEIGS